MPEAEVAVVLVTAPDGETAERLGRLLVEEHLAACVNVVPAITSIFRWKGRVESDQETLLMIKTSTGGFEALRRRVVELHPYDTSAGAGRAGRVAGVPGLGSRIGGWGVMSETGEVPENEADDLPADDADNRPVGPSDDDPSDAPPTRHEDERLGKAKTLVAGGRIRDAVALYVEILESDPANLKARHNLGVLYDELGRHSEATQQLQAAERLDPDNVDVLTNLGTSLASQARFHEAEPVLRRAQRIAPDDPEVRAALGILHFRRGMYAQAEPELRWACEREPDHGPAHYYRGESLNRLGRYEEAFSVLKRAAELLPEDPRVFYTLGHLHDRRHEPGDAAAMYRRARSLQAP